MYDISTQTGSRRKSAERQGFETVAVEPDQTIAPEKALFPKKNKKEEEEEKKKKKKNIVSLTSSLVVKMLTVLVSTLSNSQLFLLKTVCSFFQKSSANILSYMRYYI